MADEGFKRKLTAILSADVEGYSRLMGDDEEATVRTLTSYREVFSNLIQQHNGKVLDSHGDSLLAEFVSVVDAVQCGVAVQKEISARNTELPEKRRMQFRIGINLGDVIQEEGRIYGDGVNIAARLEGLAEPGGICISKTAFDQIESKLPYGYEFLGDQTVKNIDKPVGAYRVLMQPRVTVAGEPEKEKRSSMRRIPIYIGVAAVLVLAIAIGVWQFYEGRPTVEPASEENMAYELPDKPSIAVLPFDNMSGDPGQEYIADGISENIISTLSKIPDLFVIARNSTFRYKGKPIKIKQVSEELGVRYVLEGSIQKFDDRLRVSAQLIDALKGHHLWAETYDRDSKNLFMVIDEINLKIAKGLSVELYGELKTIKGAGTEDLNAWILYCKGSYHADRVTKEDNAKARKLVERAIEIDSNFAAAWALLAQIQSHSARYGWVSNRKETFKQAMETALKALAIDDSLSKPYLTLGDYYLMQRKYNEAFSEYEKAIAVNPNDSMGYWFLARAYRYTGQPEKAIPITKKGMRLSPHYPWTFPYGLGRCYYRLRQYEDAIAQFEKVLKMCHEGQCSPKWPNLYLAQVYSELGQLEKARFHMQKVLEHDPKFNLESRRKVNPYKNPADNDREIAALRKAGAPEYPPSQ